MKTLGYYKVYDWMLKVGEGFTPCTGLLAYIYSFQELSGEPCKASTKTLAEVCGCKRRKIFNDLRYLLEHGFISAQKGAKTEIVAYRVNVENCIAYAPDAQDAAELMHFVHKTYAPDAQAYAPETQELMHEMHTEYKKGIEKPISEGEEAKRGKAAPPSEEEVLSFASEIGYPKGAEFFRYYSNRQWKADNGKSIVDTWKAKMKDWQATEKQPAQDPEPKPTRSFGQSSIDLSLIKFDNESP